MAGRSLARALLCAVIAAGRVAAAAEPPRPDLVFLVDPTFGMEGGTRTFESLGRILYRYDDHLPAFLAVDERRVGGKALGMFGRLLKFTFIDGPLMQVEATAIHEIFGHGARARELGQTPTYSFMLPLPYCLFLSRYEDFGGFTTLDRTGDGDENLLLTLGGVEANYLTAWWIDVNLVQAAGWVHYADMLTYAANKLVYVGSFLSPSLAPDGPEENDVDQYVSGLQARFGLPLPQDRARIARSLELAYLWNLIDPTLVFAVYSTLVDYWFAGRRFSRLPLPSLGGLAFYPATRFNLSPFGAEHYLDLFLRRRALLLDAYVRVGLSGLASYAGGGLRLFGLQPAPYLTLGGELDLWSQPEVLAAEPCAGANRMGASGGLHATLTIYGRLALTAKLAWKTRGYLMGQPIEAGPYGYVGLSVRTVNAAQAR